MMFFLYIGYMYQITKDKIIGTINISESWSMSATGSYAPPKFDYVGSEWGVTFVNLTLIDGFKTFGYTSSGENDTRYLTKHFRLSRDGKKWTKWLELASNIDFPAWNPLNPMFLELKFGRTGSSTIGSIILGSYSISGSVYRNIKYGF